MSTAFHSLTPALDAFTRGAMKAAKATEDEFRLCIFGSRPNAALLPPEVEIDPYDHWKAEWENRLFWWLCGLAFYPDPDCLINGIARGVDTVADRWARWLDIPPHYFPFDRSKGRSGGFARNVQMSRFATHFLALWDGQSKGTEHMIWTVRRAKKPLIIIRLDRRMFE